MNDLLRMDVVDRSHDLLEERSRFLFAKKGLLLNIASEFASGGILHDEAYRIWIISHIKYPDDVWVPQIAESLNLRKDALQVRELAEAFLRHEFDRCSFACLRMHTFHDAAKSTLAKLFVQNEISNDLLASFALVTFAELERLATRDVDYLVFFDVIYVGALDAIRVVGSLRTLEVQNLARFFEKVAKLGIWR
jgi:hypothetical protein